VSLNFAKTKCKEPTLKSPGNRQKKARLSCLLQNENGFPAPFTKNQNSIIRSWILFGQVGLSPHPTIEKRNTG